MRNPLSLEPVIGNLFRIVSNPATPETDFIALETRSDALLASGEYALAAQVRLDAAVQVIELFDENDDPELTLEWEDEYTASALQMVYASASDHFAIGDFEMAAAMLELLTERDVEDHQNASELLAFCYIALEEWELFEELLPLLPAEATSTQLAARWAELCRAGVAPSEWEKRLQKEAPSLHAMWGTTEHLWKLLPELLLPA